MPRKKIKHRHKHKASKANHQKGWCGAKLAIKGLLWLYGIAFVISIAAIVLN